MPVNSRQPRASWRPAADRPGRPDQGQHQPASARQRGQGQQRTRGVAAVELVGAQERRHRPVDLRPAAVGRAQRAGLEFPAARPLHADDEGAARPEQQVRDRSHLLPYGLLLGQARLRAELSPGRADVGPRRVGRVAGLELPARDGRHPRGGLPGRREQAERVGEDRARHPRTGCWCTTALLMSPIRAPLVPGGTCVAYSGDSAHRCSSPSGPSACCWAGVGHSGRACAGSFSVAQSAAAASRPVRVCCRASQKCPVLA